MTTTSPVALPHRRPGTWHARGHTLATLLLAGAVLGPFQGIRATAEGLFGGSEADLHRIHELNIGIRLVAFLAVGLAAGALRRDRAIGGLQMAAAALAGLVVQLAATAYPDPTAWAAFLLIAAVLWRSPLSTTWRNARPSRALQGAAAFASAPLLLAAVADLGRNAAAGVGDPHAEVDHYLASALGSLTVVAVMALAARRPPGWRLPAHAASLVTGCIAGVSLLHPGTASGLPPWTAWLALAGALVWSSVVEIEVAGAPTVKGCNSGSSAPSR